jgi:hypothetical protein
MEERSRSGKIKRLLRNWARPRSIWNLMARERPADCGARASSRDITRGITNRGMGSMDITLLIFTTQYKIHSERYSVIFKTHFSKHECWNATNGKMLIVK